METGAHQEPPSLSPQKACRLSSAAWVSCAPALKGGEAEAWVGAPSWQRCAGRSHSGWGPRLGKGVLGGLTPSRRWALTVVMASLA